MIDIYSRRLQLVLITLRFYTHYFLSQFLLKSDSVFRNARVSRENCNHEITLGKHRVGAMNYNGERLYGFCENNGLTVEGTLFQHKEIHKLTWKFPDGETESNIDHIIINNKWKRSLNDVRLKRLADVGSYHHLLVAKWS